MGENQWLLSIAEKLVKQVEECECPDWHVFNFADHKVAGDTELHADDAQMLAMAVQFTAQARDLVLDVETVTGQERISVRHHRVEVTPAEGKMPKGWKVIRAR